MSVNETACESKPGGLSCPAGQWCCLDKDETVCKPCKHKIFGRCLDLPEKTCKQYGLTAWNDISKNALIAKSREIAINKINSAAESLSDTGFKITHEEACDAKVVGGKDCDPGSWCCGDETNDKTVCVPCTGGLLPTGQCNPLSDKGDMNKVCLNNKLIPYNNSAGAIAAAKKAAMAAAV